MGPVPTSHIDQVYVKVVTFVTLVEIIVLLLLFRSILFVIAFLYNYCICSTACSCVFSHINMTFATKDIADNGPLPVSSDISSVTMLSNKPNVDAFQLSTQTQCRSTHCSCYFCTTVIHILHRFLRSVCLSTTQHPLPYTMAHWFIPLYLLHSFVLHCL